MRGREGVEFDNWYHLMHIMLFMSMFFNQAVRVAGCRVVAKMFDGIIIRVACTAVITV